MNNLSAQFSFPLLQEKVKILRGNSLYRVSDILLKKGPSWRYAAKEILANPNKFKETALFAYLSKNGIDEPADLHLFHKVLSEIGANKGWLKPESEDLVIHVRLGDVLEPKHPIGPEKIFGYYGRFFAKMANEFPEKIKRLVICTALHYADFGGLYDYGLVSEVNSRQLLGNILYEAKNKSLDVDVYSNNNIDMDFYYACNSSCFVLSISDFSLIAASILKKENSAARVFPHIYHLFQRDKAGIDWSDSAKKERIILGI